MNKIPYLQQRKRTDGTTAFLVNPSKAVRDALGIGTTSYETRTDAVQKAIEVKADFEHYKRRNKNRVYVGSSTVRGLVEWYKTTSKWSDLSENSRKTYNTLLNTVFEVKLAKNGTSFADMDAAHITVDHADAIYKHLRAEISLHRAVNVCKVLRRVWYIGLKHSKVRGNPFIKMELPELERRDTMWTPDQVNQMIKKADEMGFWSIGTLTLLCYHLCQRPGDMRSLTWQQYDGEWFRFRQEKTKTDMELMASPDIVTRLADRFMSSASGDPIILCETTGTGYDRRLYAKYFARIRSAAGLPNTLQLRDLRRTGATELAESGATEDELKAQTGHKTREILSTYVRSTPKLASSAANKRFFGCGVEK